MTGKTLPEIYRKAAELVLKIGKNEGEMKHTAIDESGEVECFGYCTMGAVLDTAGELDKFGNYVVSGFVDSPEFLRLATPIADQIVRSGRYPELYYSTDVDRSFWVIANWNDDGYANAKPTAQDVAQLLRETADAVEKEDAK
ncbi:hypothetical protein E6W39_19090 [Kitasatospora acidiphila]|uniref:Uncharacterized protein n=1 Tax=Kitasatospora acidiphila TaxID=2567942 RepID=A0A540W4J7_9ACTN|nr:hypothetical protein [Kitasatospora acidiphila]TQF03958.1 hypothetical protein E6W39_19090 [Kitasatospora acidiphila]